MRVVVTGGAGFLGSHLCDRLMGRGDEVVCLDNLITGRTENVGHLFGRGGFRFIKYDVSEYIHVDGRVDAILHFASPASPADFTRFAIQILKVGSLGTHKALGLARAKKARFLLASTSEVYGDPMVSPQPESYWGHVNPVGLRGVYDESKRFAEALTMAYHRYHGLDTRIVRIFNTYGPRMRLDDGRVLPNFLGQALSGADLTVYGDGTQTRSICYVDDLVDGILILLDASHHGPVNIGNPEEMTMLQLAEEVKRLTGSESRIALGPLPPDDPKVRKPDIQLAREILGWEPRIGREEGLRRTIAYFREEMAKKSRE